MRRFKKVTSIVALVVALVMTLGACAKVNEKVTYEEKIIEESKDDLRKAVKETQEETLTEAEEEEAKELGKKVGSELKDLALKAKKYAKDNNLSGKTKGFLEGLAEEAEKVLQERTSGEAQKDLQLKGEMENDYELLKHFPKYFKEDGVAEFKREEPRINEVIYGELDRHNRPTWAATTITKETVEAKTERGTMEDPAGWPEKNSIEVVEHLDGTTYRGYFWNRSHMVAASFGGDDSYNNLITGTRAQNVGGRSNDGGMARAENLVRDYFSSNKGTVRYEVNNIYSGEELIPRRTEVNILSSDGKVNQKIIVFNLANGYNIDYNDGTFTKEAK